ncbi:MAG: hypothetical protein AAGN64_02225 [Bacteroidota bacterium]
MALQLQVNTGVGQTYTYDEVYVSPEDATRSNGIEDAELRITRSATDDDVETGELQITLKSRTFLAASEPVGIPDAGALGHRARVLLNGTEIYTGVLDLEDLVMDEIDSDRLWSITIRDDAADELAQRLAEVFCDDAGVRSAVTPTQLPTATAPTGGTRAADADWWELGALWAAVLDECDATYEGPAIRLRRRYSVNVQGVVEVFETDRRAAVRGTGFDGAPQWTGVEFAERIGELTGWRLLPRYGTWPSREIVVDAAMGYTSESTGGLRVLPDAPSNYPQHSGAPAEIRDLGIQFENFAVAAPATNDPPQQAVYASERKTLNVLGVGINGGEDGQSMIDLGWRLPAIEVTETLTTQLVARGDGRNDATDTDLGNALIEDPPTTNYLVQIGPQQTPGGGGLQETLVATQRLYVQSGDGNTDYPNAEDPLGTTAATAALWVWDVHRRLAANRAEVSFSVDCREPADGIGLPSLLERVVWRGDVWEVIEIDTDVRYPIDTNLVLARPASLLDNWFPNL